MGIAGWVGRHEFKSVYSTLFWDERNMALCKTLAELIARNMEGREIDEKKIFKTKAIGYKDYLENE